MCDIHHIDLAENAWASGGGMTKKPVLRKLTPLLLFALIGVAGMFWLVASKLSEPHNAPIAAAVAPATDIVLIASDGKKVAGTYWPGPSVDAPAILFLHGNGGSRAMFTNAARWLNGHGYAVMTIDFRGHGESAVEDHSFGLFEARDAKAASDWLKVKQEGGKIGVVGLSLGGAAALLGDDGPLPADALILQAVYPDIRRAIYNRLASRAGTLLATVMEPLLSYQSWLRQGVSPTRLSPIDAVSHYKGPLFVIGGAADQYTPPVETQALVGAYGKEALLWLVPGKDHAAVSSGDDSEYRRRILVFFDAHLRR